MRPVLLRHKEVRSGCHACVVPVHTDETTAVAVYMHLPAAVYLHAQTENMWLPSLLQIYVRHIFRLTHGGTEKQNSG